MDKATRTYGEMLMSSIAADFALLKLSEIQRKAVAYTLAWYMCSPQGLTDVNGNPVKARAFFTTELLEDRLTFYWIRGNALGSLTVSKPTDSNPPPMTGWLRSIDSVRKVELSVEVSDVNQDPVDIRPGATIHFDPDEEPIHISAHGRDDDKARKCAADFIREVRRVLAKEPIEDR